MEVYEWSPSSNPVNSQWPGVIGKRVTPFSMIMDRAELLSRFFKYRVTLSCEKRYQTALGPFIRGLVLGASTGFATFGASFMGTFCVRKLEQLARNTRAPPKKIKDTIFVMATLWPSH